MSIIVIYPSDFNRTFGNVFPEVMLPYVLNYLSIVNLYDLLMLRIYEYVQIRIDRCFDAEIIHIPTHPVDCINRSIVYEVTVIHAQPRTPDSHRIYAAGSSTARAETVNSAVLPVRQPSLVSSKMRVICADVAALTALCGRAVLVTHYHQDYGSIDCRC